MSLPPPPRPASPKSPRIACLLVPDLPLRAELRAHPQLAGRPLALASGSLPQSEVIAVSAEAAASGVQAPCSVAHARSMNAQLEVRVVSPALELATREALRDIALTFSPRIAMAPRVPGVFRCEAAVLLDASGVASLFRSEAGFAGALATRAEAMGLPGVVALASSRSVAQLVARQLALPRVVGGSETGKGATRILTPAQEAEVLAPMPVDLLNPSDTLAQELTRFGVHAVRDLLKLPRRALAQRLGSEILELVARAQGREVEAPLPEPRALAFAEAIDLDHAIATLEPLSFVLRGLISRLGERLSLRGLAWGPIDLALDLSEGAHDRRRIGLAAPTCDARVILRLLNQALEGHPPEAPVESVSLRTLGCPARVDQLDLFRPAGPDPQELDRTLAELESLCGPGRVGAPSLVDDHRPDAFALEPFSGASRSLPTPPPKRSNNVPATCDEAKSHHERCAGTSPIEKRNAPSRPAEPGVRALRPPVRAEVRTRHGHPIAIRSAVTSGEIQRAAGPWRITGRWWSAEERYVLDHFDVEVSDGSIVRLCFDWLRRDWQIDAIYD